jgi:hypothetical protein
MDATRAARAVPRRLHGPRCGARAAPEFITNRTSDPFASSRPTAPMRDDFLMLH